VLISNAEHWATIAGELQDYVRITYPTGYYFGGNSLNLKDLMADLSPKQVKFIGPKVLTIFIIGYHYGHTGSGQSWVLDWTVYDEDKTFVRDNYHKWTHNEILFYGDRDIINKSESPKFTELMEATFAKIEEDCNGEMLDFGWRWMGEIQTLVGKEFFLPEIDNFYRTA